MIAAALIRNGLLAIVRVLVGAMPRWIGSEPSMAQRIYFANHTSHVDTLAIWAALPPEMRRRTRPVAARDYWGGDVLRRYIAINSLNAVLIDRAKSSPDTNPLEPLYEALRAGDSLIIFPEGTRAAQQLPGAFKSGLYWLSKEFPDAELIPVYLDNLHRSMPKGTAFPVPLTCTVRFGTRLQRVAEETKDAFLDRARNSVVELA